MEFEPGEWVVVESESTERAPRRGVIEEKLGAGANARYRIRWQDGHESIYTPTAGALSRAKESGTKTTRV